METAQVVALVAFLLVAILVADKAPRGSEVIKDILVGTILWVPWPTIGRLAAAYVLLGALLFLGRRRFETISFEPQLALERGWRIRWWDFLFYVTFGFAVTSFVQIAGVYLVFSYLIVPSVCGALLTRHIGWRLAIGWTVALVAGLFGLLMSTQWQSMDLPTGPTIVCLFGFLLVLCGGLAWALRRRAGD